ncbi:BON domain-containing protein [Croceicoccus sediminis]|uniref:BON domain-containing protein n=1 Tax=Croceicoccus sediminis TaxID=2571150 RepID=UPI00196B3D3A|nr:BON domain-containing protein [Croceicoccus sediminis]
MAQRYERRPQYNEYETRQAEQFDERSMSQAGETATYERENSRGQYGDFDYRDERRSPEMSRQRSRDDYRGESRAFDDQTVGYTGDRYRNRGSEYGRFTGESYGGRDYAYSTDPYYAYGSTMGYPGAAAGSGYGRDYREHGYGNDRGFFEKAGDEIASWFGDDDAARRREMDHRGVGPQGYSRSDERILEDVCDHLTEDRYVDASDITVTVKDREVTLDGTVQNKGAKRRAEDRADYVTGVNHVQNNLRVSSRTTYETTPRQETTS